MISLQHDKPLCLFLGGSAVGNPLLGWWLADAGVALLLLLALLPLLAWWLLPTRQPLEAALVQDAFWRQCVELVGGVVPLWRGHLQLAGGQTEEAVQQLATRFAVLNRLMRDAVQAVQGSEHGDALLAGEAGLYDMRQRLVTVRTRHEQLSAYMVELQQLIGELQGITGGREEAGGESPSPPLAANVTRLLGLLSGAVSASRALAAEQSVLIDTASSGVATVVADYQRLGSGLTASQQQLAVVGKQVSAEIEEVLVSLQFQDRISQILGQVMHDMARLEALLAQACGSPASMPAVPDKEQWLHELRAAYTTYEQHALHDTVPPGQAGQADGSQQVTFF